jgi:hypothetical protein
MTALKGSVLDIFGASDEFEKAGISLGANFEAWAKDNYDTIVAALNEDEKAMD